MSGPCAIDRCKREAGHELPLCDFHARQTPPEQKKRLRENFVTMNRAMWRMGQFRNATACSFEAAEAAFDDALGTVCSWWAGVAL